jgi:hypothetical protein
MATQLQQEEFVEEQSADEGEPVIEQQAGNDDDGGDPEPSEEQARRLGWKPKEDYKGESEWRDWKEFLDEEALNAPQLRAANKVMKRREAQMEKRLRKMEAAFNEVKQYVTEAEERGYNRAVTDIRKRQREAVALGDTDAYDEAEQELADLTKEVKAKAPKQPEVDPEVQKSFRKWERDNDWYGSDDVMTAVADRIAAKMGTYAENDMEPDEYLEELTARVKKELPHKFKSDPLPKKRSAVEGVGETRAARNAETFENLPLEARQQYQRFIDMDVPVKKDVFTKNAWDKIRKEQRK